MKIIFKILAILVVAVLVGGLFYGTVTIASAGATQTSVSERPLPPDGEEFDGGIQFPVESIKSLAIISIVGALYLNVPKWIAGKRLPVKAIS